MYSRAMLLAVLSGLTMAAPSVSITDRIVVLTAMVADSTHDRSPILTPRDTACTPSKAYDVGEPDKVYQIQCNSDTSVTASSSKQFDSGSWHHCVPTCNGIKGCGGWTWTPLASTGGICYFKEGKDVWPFSSTTGYVGGRLETPSDGSKNGGNSNAGSEHKNACVDGPIKSPKKRHYNIKCDSDTTIPQHGFTFFYVGVWNDCLGVCDGNPGCSAFTWQPQGAGGTCWLKFSKGSIFYDAAPGYVGGILSETS